MPEPTQYERDSDERRELLEWFEAYKARRAVTDLAARIGLEEPARQEIRAMPAAVQPADRATAEIVGPVLVAAFVVGGAYVALRLVESFAWVYVRPLTDLLGVAPG